MGYRLNVYRNWERWSCHLRMDQDEASEAEVQAEADRLKRATRDMDYLDGLYFHLQIAVSLYVEGPLILKQGETIVDPPPNEQEPEQLKKMMRKLPSGFAVYDEQGERVWGDGVLAPFEFFDGVNWYLFPEWLFINDSCEETRVYAQTAYDGLDKRERSSANFIIDVMEMVDVYWDIQELMGNAETDKNAIAMSIVGMGRLLERFFARVAEPLVESELGRRRGARRGAEKANQRRAAARPDYESEVCELMGEGETYTAACWKVADDHDVVERTVRRHTKELAPKRTNGKRLS